MQMLLSLTQHNYKLTQHTSLTTHICPQNHYPLSDENRKKNIFFFLIHSHIQRGTECAARDTKLKWMYRILLFGALLTNTKSNWVEISVYYFYLFVCTLITNNWLRTLNIKFTKNLWFWRRVAHISTQRSIANTLHTLRRVRRTYVRIYSRVEDRNEWDTHAHAIHIQHGTVHIPE